MNASNLFNTFHFNNNAPLLRDLKNTQPYLKSDFSVITEPKSRSGYTYSSDNAMPRHHLRAQDKPMPSSMKPVGKRTGFLFEDLPNTRNPIPSKSYYKTNTELDDEKVVMPDGLRRSRVGGNQSGELKRQQDVMRIMTSLNVKKSIDGYKFSDAELEEMQAILPEDQYKQISGYLMSRQQPVAPVNQPAQAPAEQQLNIPAEPEEEEKVFELATPKGSDAGDVEDDDDDEQKSGVPSTDGTDVYSKESNIIAYENMIKQGGFARKFKSHSDDNSGMITIDDPAVSILRRYVRDTKVRETSMGDRTLPVAERYAGDDRDNAILLAVYNKIADGNVSRRGKNDVPWKSVRNMYNDVLKSDKKKQEMTWDEIRRMVKNPQSKPKKPAS
jgi:hypothetical protein